MNFVIIVSDTLRRDHLGCYGNGWISTPNIDKFASNALVFERAYSGSFPTVPHRRDLLTGRFTSSYTGWAPLGKDEVVLSEVLGNKEYLSMMVCDCPHILENGYHYDRGFDGFEWIRGQESDRWKTHPEVPEHPCNPAKIRGADMLQKKHRRNVYGWQYESDRFVARTMTQACNWLEDNYRRKNFFLYVDTFDPHEPWDAPQWYVDLYDPGYKGEVVDYPLYAHTDFLTGSELKHSRALYAAEVTLVDRWVGRLLEKIKDMGLMDNTVIFLTTDHGFLLGEHHIIGKSLLEPDNFSYIPLYEEINHIPLIVSVPGLEKGARCKAVVQPMDIMPTILDIAGIDVPATVHGKSFARTLQHPGQQHRDIAFSAPYLDSPDGIATVVYERFTGIIHPFAASTISSSKDLAVDGYEKETKGRTASKDLLFDIEKDMRQEKDIAGKNPELLQRMRNRFVSFLRDIGTDDKIVRRWSIR